MIEQDIELGTSQDPFQAKWIYEIIKWSLLFFG